MKSDFLAAEVSSMSAVMEFCESGRRVFIELSEHLSLVADDLEITVANYAQAPPMVVAGKAPGGGLGMNKGQARTTARRVVRPLRYASTCAYAAAGAMKVCSRLAKTTLVPELRQAPRARQGTGRMFNVNG